MQRRGFLGLLGAFAAGAVLDPERALWVRGAKTISIAAPSRNFPIAPDLYTAWALKTLMTNAEVALAMKGDYGARIAVNGGYGELCWKPGGLKIGDTIELRRPRRFMGAL